MIDVLAGSLAVAIGIAAATCSRFALDRSAENRRRLDELAETTGRDRRRALQVVARLEEVLERQATELDPAAERFVASTRIDYADVFAAAARERV
jgi:hypothetical protein